MERSVGAYMEERCYCSNFDVSRRPCALLDAVQHALVHRDSLRELALLNPPLVAQVADAGTDDVGKPIRLLRDFCLTVDLGRYFEIARTGW